MSRDGPFLEYRDEAGTLQCFDLHRSETLIGRRSPANLVLPCPRVSGHHARITRDDDGFVIRDLNSRNGTWLNGILITREPLRSGDQIRIGKTELTFWEREPVNSASTRAHAREPDEVLDFTEIMPAAGRAHSDLEKLSLLLDLQYQWERLSPDSVLRQILQHSLQISGAERGFVLRPLDAGFEFAIGLNARGQTLPEEHFRTSRTVVRKVSSERRAVFMTEELPTELALEESIREMDLRAVACLPLVRPSDGEASSAILGILYLDSTEPMHRLSGLDERILNRLAVEAANVLEKVEMLRELDEKQTLEKELAIAHETQMALLPRQIPVFEGYRVRAHCRPTRHVGGDFYDFLQLDDDRFVGVLADVSGKGVAASLVSSSLQGSLQMLLRDGRDPDAALASINQYLCDRTEPGRFVTLFLFSIRPDGKGVFVSAGHNPAFLFRSTTAQVEALPSGDLILGAFDFARYRQKPIRLEPGDVLLVYSDGITDATNRADEAFGEDRLVQLLRDKGGLGVAELEGGLLAELDRFTEGVEQTDDITFILIQRAG
jgi:serine phosphatase RsbU (regulator of sigma subunit)